MNLASNNKQKSKKFDKKKLALNKFFQIFLTALCCLLLLLPNTSVSSPTDNVIISQGSNDKQKNFDTKTVELLLHAEIALNRNMPKIALEKYLKATNGRRWRIEHAQMLTTPDIKRLKELGIVASMQPSHCTSDMKWLDDRIGEKRLHRISRWNTLLKNDIVIAGGSDCPSEEGNPIYEYYAAVTRTDHSGYPNG